MVIIVQVGNKRGAIMAKNKKPTKLNEIVFKSYQDVINKRMTAGKDVSNLTKRLNKLISSYSK